MTTTELRLYKIGAAIKGVPETLQKEHIDRQEIIDFTQTWNPHCITAFESVSRYAEGRIRAIHISLQGKGRPKTLSCIDSIPEDLLDRLEQHLHENPVKQPTHCYVCGSRLINPSISGDSTRVQ